MIYLYRFMTWLSAPFLIWLLHRRAKAGKEIIDRLGERQGKTEIARPADIKKLIWIHAASVGEAQSALILIDSITTQYPHAFFLVTTGTVTSATLMASRLPDNAVHQFYPLDHPAWVQRFINHWKPDLVLWMESELWPNMLTLLKKRQTDVILINARLSDRSFNKWRLFKQSAKQILQSFALILTQTKTGQKYFEHLGACNVKTTDNLKYSAAPLPYAARPLQELKQAIGKRPFWLFASTHGGEETMAGRLHQQLKTTFPDLLTIIVPRHPERREEIQKRLSLFSLKTVCRGAEHKLPTNSDDIYLADTLGELGLFYSLCPVAVIGRSYSDDGGGGHNPIEAAQLGCAVLTGPNVQFQQEIFDEMKNADAVQQPMDEAALQNCLRVLLQDKEKIKTHAQKAEQFAQEKAGIINHVMAELDPFLKKETP